MEPFRSSLFSGLLLCLAPVLSQATPALIEVEGNDSFATAQAIPGAAFTLAADSDIFNATAVPHATVAGHLSAHDVDYYRFGVGVAHSTGYFDIDHTTNGIDTLLTLFNSAGEVLAAGDDNCNWTASTCSSANNDPGSTSTLDAFLGNYTFAAAGTYFLAVAGVSSDYSLPFPLTLSAYYDAGALSRPDFGYGGDYYLPLGGSSSSLTSVDTNSGDYLLHFSLTSATDPLLVPEPGMLALLGLSLPVLMRVRRRR